MNVIFISREYPPEAGWGGIGSYTYNISRGLVKLGHKVIVLTISIDGEELHNFEDGVEVYRLALKHLVPISFERYFYIAWYETLKFSYAIKEKITEINKTEKIDIIEYPESFGDGLLVGKLNMKKIVRLHSGTKLITSLNRQEFNFSQRIIHWIERKSINQADLILSNSKALLEAEKPIYKWKNIPENICPLPVNIDLFVPAKNAQSSKPVKILFVGRIERKKGIESLFRAVEILAGRRIEFHVTLVGKDTHTWDGKKSMIGHWMKWAKEHGIDKYFTHRDHVSYSEIPSYYQNCDIFVAPSIWESFGMIYLEAMACSKPVIGTRNGGALEVLEDGINGFLVEPNNPGALAYKLEILIKDAKLRAKIGMLNRKNVEERFSSIVIAKQQIDIYHRVIKKISKPPCQGTRIN